MSHGQAWLGATSLHSKDPRVPGVLSSLRQLGEDNPRLHLIVNWFNANASTARIQLPRLQFTYVPGMKGLFWKSVMTPQRTSGFHVVWLFDSDVAAHPSVLPLATIIGTLLATNASLLQPAIRAAGGETQHSWRV